MSIRGLSTETTFHSAYRGVLIALVAMSFVVNILALTGSIYMMQVYDRVLSSHSMTTLVALSVLAASLYVFQMLLEVIRARVMRRVGDRMDARLMPLAQQTAMRLPLGGVSGVNALQPVRDVDTIRGYLSGQGPIAFFDLPWIPIYLIFAAALHPILGLMTLGGVVILIALTLISERVMRDRSAKVLQMSLRRQAMADENARNAEAAQVMGFADRARDRFLRQSDEMLQVSAKASDAGNALASLSRVFRMMLQSAMLGMGAYLTIKGEVTGGAIIAGSIVSSRALAPVELAISNWRGFSEARRARSRLAELFDRVLRDTDLTELPAPKATLRLENLTVLAPGSRSRVLEGVSFELLAGQGLGIIGPSGAGKSTLARAIIGAWPAAGGSVRIDGATLDQWGREALGRHIGYVPQDVQLFDGTVAENICRFESEPDADAIIKAATAANVHQLILRLPQGYDTRIGSDGSVLSAGQRQRVALARALYRDPFLVVLDEPNSNLDAEGEAALIEAIQAVRARGGVVIMIAHRSNALAAVDQVAIVNGGRLTAFGPRDEVLRKVLRGASGGAPGRAHPPGPTPPQPSSATASGGAGPVTLFLRNQDGSQT